MSPAEGAVRAASRTLSKTSFGTGFFKNDLVLLLFKMHSNASNAKIVQPPEDKVFHECF
jgi:hypothetical protein